MTSIDQEAIDNEQVLLTTHRRRLAYRLRQQARLGDHTPPDVALDIEDSQLAIRDLKTKLRTAGVVIADEPADDPVTHVPPLLMPTTQQLRNRTRMLQKVRDFWIKGVLENSLHGAVLIILGLEERPEAVIPPWEVAIQSQSGAARPLPSGTPIADVFDQQSGELLILGGPGSGKTMLLLELARTLLDRAEQDISHPLPVVFNLSSWAEQRPPLATWMVDELNKQYDVPRKVGQEWLNGDLILPLLDGLDEVRQEYRNACVMAINAFRKEHGMVNVVVCSRVADYEALTKRLKLYGAVLVRSLTRDQIDDFLAGAGDQLVGLQAALVADTTLQELAETPLMLSVMALAYQGLPAEQVLAAGQTDTRHRQLFDRYIERMFVRRGVNIRFPHEQTTRWLTWLAQSLQNHQQSIFFIERLQPSWLTSRIHLSLYNAIVWVILGIFCAFPVFVGNAFLTFFTPADIALLLGLGALAGLLVGSIWDASHFLAKLAPYWLRRRVKNIPTLLGVAVSVILIVGLWGYINALSWFISSILILRLLCGSPDKVKQVDTFRWSWSRALRGFVFVFVCLLLGIVVAWMTAAFTTWLLLDQPSSLIAEIATVRENYAQLFNFTSVFLAIIAFAILLAVVEGVRVAEVGISKIPNQGMRRSGRNALLAFIVGDLLTSFIAGPGFSFLMSSLSGGGVDIGMLPGSILLTSVTFGFAIGLIAALVCGEFALLQHLTLRGILWRNGAIPLRYAYFLDYCAERIFLRKVGGGYIFIHRLLLEHFASLEQQQSWVPTVGREAARNQVEGS